VPLVLKSHHFKQGHAWDVLIEDAKKEKRGCDVVGLIQSPKNIGACNNQFMFFVKGSNEMGTPVFKIMKRDDNNWDGLVEEVKAWCNKYIPPHALVSISLYEDAHPNDGNGINACITHTAGDDPKPLSDDVMKAAAGNIYDIQVIAGPGEWEDMFNEAKQVIN